MLLAADLHGSISSLAGHSSDQAAVLDVRLTHSALKSARISSIGGLRVASVGATRPSKDAHGIGTTVNKRHLENGPGGRIGRGGEAGERARKRQPRVSRRRHRLLLRLGLRQHGR